MDVKYSQNEKKERVFNSLNLLRAGHRVGEHIRGGTIAGIDREGPVGGPALPQDRRVEVGVPPRVLAGTKRRVKLRTILADLSRRKIARKTKRLGRQTRGLDIY